MRWDARASNQQVCEARAGRLWYACERRDARARKQQVRQAVRGASCRLASVLTHGRVGVCRLTGWCTRCVRACEFGDAPRAAGSRLRLAGDALAAESRGWWEVYRCLLIYCCYQAAMKAG